MGSNVSTLVKRLFVRNIQWTATASSKTIAEVLQTVAQARMSAISGGKILISNAGNGHQATFQIPTDITPTDLAELCSEILNRYEEASEKLIDCGNATPSDSQLIVEIMRHLPKNGVTVVTNDYRSLRLPDGGCEGAVI